MDVGTSRTIICFANFLQLLFISLHITLKICYSNLKIIEILFAPSLDLHIDTNNNKIIQNSGVTSPFQPSYYDSIHHIFLLHTSFLISHFSEKLIINIENGRFKVDKRIYDRQNSLVSCPPNEDCPHHSFQIPHKNRRLAQ